ncbi:MAG: NUDIX domain-containing protein [Anaerovoracaceae bacterium]
MSDHLVDIYDENFELIGQELKSIAHERGYWHQVFTCVIINSKDNKIYFQKKVTGRYTFERPDYIDITVGGHLEAGETVESGVREIEEETGMVVEFGSLVNLGLRQNTFCVKDKYYANEYQNLFLYDTDCKLHDFKMDEHEVSGFVEADIDQLLLLLFDELESVEAKHAFVFERKYVEEKCALTKKDIIPSYLKNDMFMLRLVIAVKRYCKGENTQSLFW